MEKRRTLLYDFDKYLQQLDASRDVVDGIGAGQTLVVGQCLEMIQPCVHVSDHFTGGQGVQHPVGAFLMLQGECGIAAEEHGGGQIIMVADLVMGGENVELSAAIAVQHVQHILQMGHAVGAGNFDGAAECTQLTCIHIIHQCGLVQNYGLEEAGSVQIQTHIAADVTLSGGQTFLQAFGKVQRLHMLEQAAAVGLHEVVQKILVFSELLHIGRLTDRGTVEDIAVSG